MTQTELLKAALKERGVTQRAVAERLGTTEQALSKTLSRPTLTTTKLAAIIDAVNALAPYRDPLTGVKSRVAYTSAVAELERQIPDHCEPFGLVVFDSNDLKHVNDLYGHEAGNAYIRHICRIICEVFKHSPVYRVGGDEFTVLLRNKDLQNHDALFRSLDGAFAAAPFRTADHELPILVARGLAIFDPRTDRAFNDVFDRADKRMYDHKHLMKAENQ